MSEQEQLNEWLEKNGRLDEWKEFSEELFTEITGEHIRKGSKEYKQYEAMYIDTMYEYYAKEAV